MGAIDVLAVGRVGVDLYAEQIRDALERFGVDTRFVGSHGSLRTPLAIAAADSSEAPTLRIAAARAEVDAPLDAGARA
jgi:sugar/nucleoside kinase (ribokinase family)